MADATDTQQQRPQGPAEGEGTDEGGTTTATTPQGPQGAAGTLSGQPLREPGGGSEPRREAHGGNAVVKAATGAKLSDKEQAEALDWLLQADPDPGEVETKVLELNFGTDRQPKIVNWEIQPVDIDTMRSIRDRARNTRQARRQGVDEYRMNLQIVAAGTKTPNVYEAARIAQEQGNGTGDVVALLKARFQSKPGYIAQIAAEIMSLSGFDEDDVTEKDMVAAAGNS